MAAGGGAGDSAWSRGGDRRRSVTASGFVQRRVSATDSNAFTAVVGGAAASAEGGGAASALPCHGLPPQPWWLWCDGNDRGGVEETAGERARSRAFLGEPLCWWIRMLNQPMGSTSASIGRHTTARLRILSKLTPHRMSALPIGKCGSDGPHRIGIRRPNGHRIHPMGCIPQSDDRRRRLCTPSSILATEAHSA